MKIIQINSVCGKGSTGRLALDIAKASELAGHKNYIAYGYGTTDYDHSYKIGNRIEHLFHNIFFSRLLGLQGFGSIVSTIRLINWIDKIQPDIIHLHNLHANYLNTYLLFRHIIRRKLPVMFTLHDCLNFTGKCTYYTSADCMRWKVGCHHCPLKKKSGVPSLFFDWSAETFHLKQKLYKRLFHCRTIAVSKWLEGMAAQSILNDNGHQVGCIYNWIDHQTFKPSSAKEVEECAAKYHLGSDKKYLISVSQDWRIGFGRLEDALSLAQLLPGQYCLLLVGDLSKDVVLPENVTHIPYVSSRKELATLYTIAEAYLHFSIQDTFGLVIGEAMACGTIPITYDSTACSETPAGYGIVVPPRDVKAMAKALSQLAQKQKHAAEMIRYVKQHYDKEANTNEYIKTYATILKTRNELTINTNNRYDNSKDKEQD